MFLHLAWGSSYLAYTLFSPAILRHAACLQYGCRHERGCCHVLLQSCPICIRSQKPTRALNKSAHSHRYLQDLPAGLSTFNDTCLAQQHGHQTVLQNVEHVKRIVQVCASATSGS